MLAPQSYLLLSTTAIADGAWFYIGNARGGSSVVATGVGGDTIDIRVSNNDGQTPPATGANGVLKVAAFTADTIVPIPETYSWISARKTVAGTTATTVRWSGLIS